MQPQQPHYVLQIHFVGRPAAVQTFTAARVVVGRDAGDIVLADTEASATHAELEFQNGQLVVRDLGSSNGTWKDGRNLPQFAMSAGESFTCGKTVITVTHIVGAAHQAAGATVMGDGSKMIAELQRQKAAMAAAAAPPVTKGSSALPIALGLGAVVLIGGGATAFFMMRSSDAPVTTAAAEVDEPDVEVTEPDVPPMPKLDVPMPVPDEKDPDEDAPVVEKDMGELYKQVGAATVVIRVPGSVGSGSIIDPKGVILTNHHVIDGGEREGLRIKVDVTLGTYSEELQAFEPREKTLKAYVLEVDIDHDLALIQLIDPPADLPSLSLSEKAPYPGQRVAAVGHAGAGLLWALKGGEVSSTGKLAGHTDLALDGASGAQKEHLAQLKAKMDKQGRVIQSTAKILPGDSGGPLVSTAGEIVGVNAFVRNDRTTGQWLSFHVHLAEVQALMAEIPDHPLDFIPDPWTGAAATVHGGDVDLDGRIDTVVASSGGFGGSIAYFLDLDQSSLGKGEALPSWDDLTKDDDRPFDPELIVADDGGNRSVWYDTDDDGHFDVYMLGSVGNLTDAYRVPRDGSATRDADLLVREGLSGTLFVDTDVKERFAQIGPIVFPGAVEPADGGVAMPNPRVKAETFLAADHDGDGTNDTFAEATYFHRRFMFDLDQNAGVNSGYDMARNVGSADVEVVVLEQGASRWVWYDSDDDGTLETVLHTAVLGFEGASKSWVSQTPSAGNLGRVLLRQDLVAGDDARARFAAAVPKAMHGQVAQTGQGIDSFPPLTFGPRASVAIRDAAGLTNAVAMVTEYGRDLVLVDLDGDTAPEGTSNVELAKLARAGSFDAEFAMLKVNEARWAFYDTDGKNGFDMVVVASTPKDRTPTAAYSIGKGGVVTEMEAGASLVRTGPFRKPLRAPFEKAAPTLFPGQVTE
ncbi:MAG: trypsin-like peptidase domain-containing protein [Myxococcota bacterium]